MTPVLAGATINILFILLEMDKNLRSFCDGYAILAVTNVADLYQIRRLAASYPLLDASARAALESAGTGTLDPTLSLRFMALGPSFLVAGWVALRTRNLPEALAYLGIAAGSAALLAAATSFLDLQGIALGLVTGAVAVVIHPVWLTGVGLALGRTSQWSGIDADVAPRP